MHKPVIYVWLQFTFLALVVFSGRLIPHLPWAILWFLGVYNGLSAIWYMRQSKLSIFPVVRPGSSLVTRGPYHYMRHPMYTSLILVSVAYVIDQFSWVRLASLLGLIITLVFKIRYEERQLVEYFEEYRDYQRESWRLVPFVY